MPSSSTKHSSSTIRVRGANTNNLRSVDVDIPRDQLVVITGVSGSGKSSLAFDTLFSEGRRQFIETQSVYTRQFFQQLPRADVESIHGLQPTLAIDQHVGYDNPRSTVATITEIYDYLRILVARCGDVTCHECGAAIQHQTVEQIRDRLMRMKERTKLMVMAPVVRDRVGQHLDAFEKIRNERLVRVRIDGDVFDIEEIPELNPKERHTIEAVTDRIIIREGVENRLIESLELAVRLGEGVVTVAMQDLETAEWSDATFSTKYSCPVCDLDYVEVEPRTFSFNSPYGACETCSGMGEVQGFDIRQTVPDPSLSIRAGAIECWSDLTAKGLSNRLKTLAPLLEELGVNVDLPVVDWKPNQLETLWKGTEKNQGIWVLLEKEIATETDLERLERLETFVANVECPDCQGTRLNPLANSVFINGFTIAQIVSKSISESIPFFEEIRYGDFREQVAQPLKREIIHRLEYLERVGVGYLTLNRSGRSLSGGEHQRVRLASAIGTGLTKVCFVLDEPSIGLHQRDNERLIHAIRQLQQRGNSVVVVEHDEEMMREADYLIDVGPRAGKLGGHIIAAGTPKEVAGDKQSVTGQYLSGAQTIEIPVTRRSQKVGASIRIEGASGFNLKEVDAEIPLGLFCCITGVSGSGKSTLLTKTLAPALRRHLGLSTFEPGPYRSLVGVDSVQRLVQVDQRPLSRHSRGCVATYSGVMDELRKIFALTKESKRFGYSASRFSFNSKSGSCAECKGHGQKRIKMNFLPDMDVKCPVCQGKRFNAQTLQVRFRGLSIADVLELPIDRAAEEFKNVQKIDSVLKCMVDVGLGYLSLGQPSSTFSGGEAQRIKLATELSRQSAGHTIYIMDEPTSGLHFEDIRRLLDVIYRLVEKGNTVIVIEHNLDVIKCADWIVDLGPDGGEEGGELVASGTPEQLAKVEKSFTGHYLKKILNG